ncbi:histone H1 [Anopheles gambiae]|uniref:histone H1 n=2 Tax=gambiae species complex TaxID=44542 RepID=UPI002AC9BD62|nr:histone H1 [Anopheles gambiae]
MIQPKRLTFSSPAMMAKEVKVLAVKPLKPEKGQQSEPEEQMEEITNDNMGNTTGGSSSSSTAITTTTISQDKNGKNGKKTYEQMMIEAITENDPHRKGISFALIKKFIKGKYQIETEVAAVYMKRAYEKLTTKSIVERVSGKSGINGSIRLTKAHVDKGRKQQSKGIKQAEKAAKKAAKTKPKAKKQADPKPKQTKKDKNNNDGEKKQKKEKPAKAKPAQPVKLNPKKTAITKTKIDRSGGKVRLSIVSSTDPGPSGRAKPTSKAAKGGKAAKTKSDEMNRKPTAAKPQPVRAGREKKQ